MSTYPVLVHTAILHYTLSFFIIIWLNRAVIFIELSFAFRFTLVNNISISSIENGLLKYMFCDRVWLAAIKNLKELKKISFLEGLFFFFFTFPCFFQLTILQWNQQLWCPKTLEALDCTFLIDVYKFCYKP